MIKSKTFQQAGKENFTHNKPSPKQCNLQQIKPGEKIKSNKLKLTLSPLQKIPDWHPGKGKHGWLFIDEIKVY